MKKVMLICIWIAIVPFSLFSCKDSDDDSLPPPPESEKRAEWELVFEENFDGNVINPEIWSIYNSVGHAGNGVRSPEAISIEDGLLVITAQMKEVQENVDGVIQTVEKLYSGGMAHKVNYKYGKFEFRVRSDADPSGATSAVVLTWPKSEDWPNGGENDIYETYAESNPTRDNFQTNILSGLPRNTWQKKIHDIDAKEWHVVAMEWEEHVMRIYIDGQLKFRLTDPKDFPHELHHLCIQLDAFSTIMTGATKMYVDWVKIYQEKK